jgi:hypothetical protein
MHGPIRLRQRGTVFAFSQKCCTECNIFVKKHGIFRPAGGDMLCQVSDRVSRDVI